MSTENNIAIVTLTENGKNLAIKVSRLLGNCDIYYKGSKNNGVIEFTESEVDRGDINSNDYIQKSSIVYNEVYNNINFFIIDTKLKEFVGEIFLKYENIVFIMATGIVVRCIAPYIQSKFNDPAIVVMDEYGKNVISLLSGHLGGANELALKVSKLIEANPVITTATDVNKKSSLDMIAKKLNAYIYDFRENVKEVNSLLVNNKPVGIYIDGDYDIDLRGFEVLHFNRERNSIDCESMEITQKFTDIKDNKKAKKFKKIIVITNKKEINKEIKGNVRIELKEEDFIKVVPKDIVVGIGCRRDTNSELMFSCFVEFLNSNNIDINSIVKIGSIEIKKDEKAIIELAQRLEVPFCTFSKDEISKVDELYEKSNFVKKNVGVNSVSEPIVHLMSNGNLTVKKHKYSGITFALGRLKK